MNIHARAVLLLAAPIGTAGALGHPSDEPDGWCGLRALAACMSVVGKPHRPAELAALLPLEAGRASFAELADVAERCGLFQRALRWPRHFERAPLPAVILLHLREGNAHFVAVTEARGSQFQIVDGQTRIWLLEAELRRLGWNGVALHIAAQPSHFKRLEISWWRRPPIHWATAAALFGASAVILAVARRRSAVHGTRLPRGASRK